MRDSVKHLLLKLFVVKVQISKSNTVLSGAAKPMGKGDGHFHNWVCMGTRKGN